MPSREAQAALDYAPERLFDLAADVESYPEFLPWWIGARVRTRAGNVYHTEQIIGFGTFRARFETRTVLERPERIVVTSSDRIFRTFHLEWHFQPLPENGGENGCRTVLQVELELRSTLAQALFNRAISHSAGSIMSAFEARAHQIHGAAASNRPTQSDGGKNGAII